ncbi:alpha/beta hydrolase superfamily esterase [Rickettsia australis]|uniref:Alpha/beta hydrolase superfamily esterase n=1 Tax=Rickettsia australis (strain Cutlack) TaxID=1105110 RepID=H8K971_RICAC|nr:alpha/beta hydrolase superfamily esterase [Rickettsia australis]AFC70591.1 alpha/beta hydrolase superfamily esterase [Rickettsia australis str. Cutlack]
MLEINNLAFAGGGVKVIAYAGALKALIKDKGFDHDITFKQLHDSQKTSIDLYVVILISVLNFQKFYLMKMLLIRKS